MSDYLEMSPEYAVCQGGFDYPEEDPTYDYMDDPAYEAFLSELETDNCPEDGPQDIVRYDTTGGSDPYAINVLACKHRVINFGDGNVIV